MITDIPLPDILYISHKYIKKLICFRMRVEYIGHQFVGNQILKIRR